MHLPGNFSKLEKLPKTQKIHLNHTVEIDDLLHNTNYSTLYVLTWLFFQIGKIAKDTENTLKWFIFLGNFKQR